MDWRYASLLLVFVIVIFVVIVPLFAVRAGAGILFVFASRALCHIEIEFFADGIRGWCGLDLDDNGEVVSGRQCGVGERRP